MAKTNTEKDTKKKTESKKKTTTKKVTEKKTEAKNIEKKTTKKKNTVKKKVETPVVEEKVETTKDVVVETTVNKNPEPQKKDDIVKVILVAACILLTLLLIGTKSAPTENKITKDSKIVAVNYLDNDELELTVPGDWYYSQDIGGFLRMGEDEKLTVVSYCYYTTSVTENDWAGIKEDVTTNYETMDISSTGKDNVIVILSNEEGITPYKDILAYYPEVQTFFEIVVTDATDAQVLTLINNLK